MSKGKQLTDRDAIATFILAGRSTFTVVSTVTRTRLTFKVQKKAEAKIWFVSVLAGPDNWKNYKYIGTLKNRGARFPEFQYGNKSEIHSSALCVEVSLWFFNNLDTGNKLDQVEFWHEGKCARCGKKLTVPESISSGFGPECEKIIGLPRQLNLPISYTKGIAHG